MYRLLKPGGRIIHTLDVEPMLYEYNGKAYFAQLQRLGFLLPHTSGVDFSRIAHDGILLEPASIVSKYYHGNRPGPWAPQIRRHSATVKIVAVKP